MFKKIDKIPILFRRLVTIIILGALVLFVGLGVLARCSMVDEPPSVKQAPWAIQTDTRIYYAKEFRLVGKTPEIRGYWTLEGKRFNFNKDVKDFPEDLYPYVKIIKRTPK